MKLEETIIDAQRRSCLRRYAIMSDGHFVTPHLRLARAFAWCINKLTVYNE